MTVEYYCRICGDKITKSVKSHLLTKSSYWGGTRWVVLDDGSVDDANKQAWETKLLCGPCDHRLGRWEGERQKMLLAERDRPCQTQNEQYGVVDRGYNIEYIVLAFLTDILRCSLTSHQIYSGVNLGQKHTERILEVLREGRIHDFNEYAVTLGRYSAKDSLDGMAEIPCKRRLGPRKTIYYRTFMPGGWVWMIRISQQSSIEALDVTAITKSDIKVINLGDFDKSLDFELALKNALIMKKAGKI